MCLAWGKAFRVFGSHDLPGETCNNCRLCSWLPHGTWPTPSTFFYLNMRINYIQRGSERSWMLRSLHTSFGHSHPHVSLHSRVSFLCRAIARRITSLPLKDRCPIPWRISGGWCGSGSATPSSCSQKFRRGSRYASHSCFLKVL